MDQQSLKVAAKSLHLGVDETPENLERVFADTSTADALAVAEWLEEGAERALVTQPLKKGRVEDLVELFMERQDRPVLMEVLRGHQEAENVHAAFTAAFGGTDVDSHKAAATFVKAHAPAKQALTGDLRRTPKDPADNKGQIERAAHAKVAGVIDVGELNRLLERDDTTSENLVVTGLALTADGRKEVVVYLVASERRVDDLFELALPQDEHKAVVTINQVVLDAITGHTSPKMDQKLLSEMTATPGKNKRNKAAARLSVLRREVKNAATGATAPAAAPKPKSIVYPAAPAPDPTPAEGEATAETAEGDAASS